MAQAASKVLINASAGIFLLDDARRAMQDRARCANANH
jgi:hypothetical protein